MADLDLATILADGEYLKRSGDLLVGDVPSTGGGETAVPPGGTIGQVLAKDTGTDYDVSWQTIEAEGGGGSTILDGTGPPDIALGAVGNYYEDTTNGILYGPKSSSGWGTAQRPTIAGLADVTTSTTDEGGARYRFARAGRVTGCRYQRDSAAATTVTIKAWNDATLTKIREVADTQAGVDGTFTVTFPTPVVIGGGETWTFTYANTGAISRNTSAQAVTNTADVSFIESRSNTTIDNYPATVYAGTYYVEPIFEPNEAWPVTVRTVASALTVADAELAAIAGLTSAADQVPYFTGSGTAALTTITSTARGLLDDTTYAAMRTSLSLVVGTDVAPARTTIVTHSGTAITAALTDAQKYLRFTGTNPTYTVPPNSTVAFPVGTQIDGIGVATAMTLIQGSGVTITKARTLVTVGAGSGWTLVKTGTDAWDAHGDFT